MIINWFIYLIAFVIGNATGYYQRINIVGFLNGTVKPFLWSYAEPHWSKANDWWSTKAKPYVTKKQTLIAEKIDYYEDRAKGGAEAGADDVDSDVKEE